MPRIMTCPPLIRSACACSLAALAFAAGAAAAADGLRLDAPRELAPLLQRHLSVLDPAHGPALDDETERLALLRRARREVAALLATEGYFSPEVALDRGGEGWRLTVAPGTRTTVSAVVLTIRQDSVLAPEERAAWLERFRDVWPLHEGVPFTQAAWDAGKSALIEQMSRRVFAAARIRSSRAEVGPEAARVTLAVEVDPGPRFSMGALAVEGLVDYDADLVSRYQPPVPGEAYDEDRLLEFQTALQNTPYFASAVVDIDRDPARAGETPVRVLVSEAKPRRTSVGAGFSTNSGYRGELGYRDANLFGKAWQLAAGLRVEQRESLLFADIFFPPARAGYRDSVGALHERSDLEGLQVTRDASGVTRSYPLPKGELSVSLKYQLERTRPDGAPTTRQRSLSGDVGVVWRDVDALLEPRRGYVAHLRLGGASEDLAATQTFVRAYGRVQTFFPVALRDVLSLRAELGKTFASSRDGVPQEFLFRAGGSQSVRGYAYRSLGVDQGDAVVGGRYLATASAEYTHWRSDGWGGAVFVDAGNASDDADTFRLLAGYGAGARWKSPAGPLALDLAWGQEDRRWRLHFAISVAF